MTPLVVPVPTAALAAFPAAVEAAEDVTWDAWPRDTDGRPLDGSTTETSAPGAPLQVTLIVLDGDDPHWAVAGAAWWLRHDLTATVWPRSAHPAATDAHQVLAAADLERGRHELDTWAAALDQVPFDVAGRARVRTAHAALAAVLPAPTADPAPAALPELPATDPDFDADALAATLQALRTFCAANVVAHSVFGHGKSWEPQAVVRVTRAGHWMLKVASYQYRELADRASKANGAPATVRAAAQRLADDAAADAARLLTDPEWADDAAGVPDVAATLAGDDVSPLPPVAALVAALPAFAAAGTPATVGFGPGGSWSIDVPHLDAHVQLDGPDGCDVALRRLLALTAARRT